MKRKFQDEETERGDTPREARGIATGPLALPINSILEIVRRCECSSEDHSGIVRNSDVPLGQSRIGFGETPNPARGTRALP
jgi:hypothetical protein